MDDLMDVMERSIRRRRWGDPVRIEVSRDISEAALGLLENALDLNEDEIYRIHGPLDLTVWMNFAGGKEFSYLRNKPFPPRPVPAFIDTDNLFNVIRHRDVLVHHPYMSFDSVVRFVQEAAADPKVLAIKQTLYRVSGKSPIVSALIAAAENGKQVTVLVELRARFDEENNIIWAKKLEQAGVHVVYGLVGLKTHCKVCLVVRRDDDGIRRYVHLSTGNYNDTTAKIYADTGHFTCRENIGQDSSTLFNALTGYSRTTDWLTFAVAPISMRPAFLRLIETETQNAQAGLKAAITAKMNSLSDIEIIHALYRASMAGVEIRLLVRGICCLRAGIPGVSENITVSSIVDRFLEHNRLFIFENGGAARVFISSADWMPRNLDRRVEVLYPVEDAELGKELIDELELSLSDNIKRRVQQPDGTYQKPDRRGKAAVQSQSAFYKQIAARYTAAQEETERGVFRPIYR
jgi:polyphosphate kinase